MSINRERLVTITAYYYTEPTVISVPAHFSLDETREAIHGAIRSATQGAPTAEPPSTTSSGEFFIVPHTLL